MNSSIEQLKIENLVLRKQYLLEKQSAAQIDAKYQKQKEVNLVLRLKLRKLQVKVDNMTNESMKDKLETEMEDLQKSMQEQIDKIKSSVKQESEQDRGKFDYQSIGVIIGVLSLFISFFVPFFVLYLQDKPQVNDKVYLVNPTPDKLKVGHPISTSSPDSNG